MFTPIGLAAHQQHIRRILPGYGRALVQWLGHDLRPLLNVNGGSGTVMLGKISITSRTKLTGLRARFETTVRVDRSLLSSSPVATEWADRSFVPSQRAVYLVVRSRTQAIMRLKQLIDADRLADHLREIRASHASACHGMSPHASACQERLIA